MARKNKYETHVLPFLKIIEGWCRKGITDEVMAEKLGVAYSTFRKYRKEHPELEEAMKTSKELADIEVENALFKRATGYDYVETVKETDKEGIETSRICIKHNPGDVKAQQFWLKNRNPDDWNDKFAVDVQEKLEDLL